jgi:hypothetical protein
MTFPIYEVQENGVIKRTQADGTVHWIPADPANSDYQAYLNPDKVEHLTEIVPPVE